MTIDVEKSFGWVLAGFFTLYSVFMIFDGYGYLSKGVTILAFMVVLFSGGLYFKQFSENMNERSLFLFPVIIILLVFSLILGDHQLFKLFRVLNLVVVLLAFISLPEGVIKSFSLSLIYLSLLGLFLVTAMGGNPNGYGYIIAVMYLLNEKSFRVAIPLTLILFFLGARGAALLLIIGVLIEWSVITFQLNRNRVNYILFLVLGLLIVFQLYIAMLLYDSELLNQILTKRPYIWGFYLDEILSSSQWVVTGLGEVSIDVAEDAGSFVSLFSEFSRAYSPHSSYIVLLYEYGLVSSLILLFCFYIIIDRSSQPTAALVFLLFLMSGFSVPVQFGGVRVYDYLFVILLALNMRRARSRVV